MYNSIYVIYEIIPLTLARGSNSDKNIPKYPNPEQRSNIVTGEDSLTEVSIYCIVFSIIGTVSSNSFNNRRLFINMTMFK